MTPQETIALINLAELLIEKGVDVYGHMRELAAQNGISEDDMKAADARFAKEYTDPLGGSSTIGDGPAPSPDPYAAHFDSVDTARAAGKTGDRIYSVPDGQTKGYFRLVYGGAGIPIPANWSLVETIGG